MHPTRRGLLPLGIAVLAGTGPTWAQHEAVALEGAEVFDGERRLGPATILLAGDTIRAVGPTGAVRCHRARAVSTSPAARSCPA